MTDEGEGGEDNAAKKKDETTEDKAEGDEEGEAAEEEKPVVPEVPPPPPKPRGPADLHMVLEEPGVKLTDWLSLISFSGAFLASTQTRILLSSHISVVFTFDVRVASGPTPQEVAERRRRAQRTRSRVPQEVTSGPLRMHLFFALRDIPVRRASLNRALGRVSPMVRWEECEHVRIACRSDLDAVDGIMYKYIGSMTQPDTLAMLEYPPWFQNLERITLTITQVAGLARDFNMPQVRRLKLLCRDASFAKSDRILERVPGMFPNLGRLHLVVVPTGLIPLCGPVFSAPPDLRITLLTDRADKYDCQANMFVASHLLTMPFSWRGHFLGSIVRLQMTELNQEHKGLALEQLTDIFKSMPSLRRIGTVSLRTSFLLDLVREGSPLEEIVMVMDQCDQLALFKSFLPLEQHKRRMKIKRFAVHLLAEDGVSRPEKELEDAICAGWHRLATEFLRWQKGFVVFSVGHRQLLDTAAIQLPWFEPNHFSLDWVDYEADGRVPVSTPLDRPLPHHLAQASARPRGTLVSGALRPSAAKTTDLDATDDSLSCASPTSPAPPTPTPSRGKGHMPYGSGNGGNTLSSTHRSSLSATGSNWKTGTVTPKQPGRHGQRTGQGFQETIRRPAFLDISLNDAVDTLMKHAAEEF